MLSNEYPWNHHFISRNWNHNFSPNHSFFLTEGTRTLASVTISLLVCLVLPLSVYPQTLQLVLSAVVHAHLCFASFTFTFICFWDSLRLQALQWRQLLLFLRNIHSISSVYFFKSFKKKKKFIYLAVSVCSCGMQVLPASFQDLSLQCTDFLVVAHGLSSCVVWP